MQHALQQQAHETLEACKADPMNEGKMRAALELCTVAVIAVTPLCFTKPWNLLNIKLCKETEKPVILVCWADSDMQNELLDGLMAVACIQLGKDEKLSDPAVRCLITRTMETRKNAQRCVIASK